MDNFTTGRLLAFIRHEMKKVEELAMGAYGEQSWKISIDTEATTVAAKTAQVPVNLYEQPGIIIDVDWGDNTTTRVTSDSFSGPSDFSAVTHTYAAAGEYDIEIISRQWPKLALYGDMLDGTSPVQVYKDTLVSMTPLPRAGGVYDANGIKMGVFASGLCSYCRKLTAIPEGFFDENPHVTEAYGVFRNCTSLTSIPLGIFDALENCVSFSMCFRACSGITSLPSGIFDNNKKLKSVLQCFYGTNLISIDGDLFKNNTQLENMQQFLKNVSTLGDFSLTIPAEGITNAIEFCPKKTGATRTINVPSGSATKDTFDAVANELGLTIIGN